MRARTRITFLDDNGEKFFGEGPARLLHAIAETGSLRAASMSMNMAYSKAWTVIHRCEDILGFPLLVCSTGGRHGGGAAVTPEARSLLEAYERYCQRLRQSAETLFQEEFREWISD